MTIETRDQSAMELRPALNPGLDLSWLDGGDGWGTRAEPGRKGLTLEGIAIGRYGDIPETSRNYTLRLRGTRQRAGALRVTSCRSPERRQRMDPALAVYLDEK